MSRISIMKNGYNNMNGIFIFNYYYLKYCAFVLNGNKTQIVLDLRNNSAPQL